MSNDEEAFRRIMAELRILEGTAEALQNRMNLVSAARTELSFASATIEGLEREGKGAPLLVPIGGGSFIKAKVTTIADLVVGMGAGVSAEKPRKEAKKILEKRIGELENSEQAFQQQLGQVLERINVNKQHLDELSARLSGRQQVDVRKAKNRTQRAS
ncbi:MAG: prefoldin subunit alpha [Candidatus Bathyarchaeota archaeon]|nr:MAG: prefoldin subunit alpha [Candidatus Bathyarchaeota archaeon]